mmetsp:Transcript_13074/g.19728  ORF Transcript_13074/g.19728 Transcript_13074/m.19728 type:complete len:334 (-) Transcript_13074:101-1102(-)
MNAQQGYQQPYQQQQQQHIQGIPQQQGYAMQQQIHHHHPPHIHMQHVAYPHHHMINYDPNRMNAQQGYHQQTSPMATTENSPMGIKNCRKEKPNPTPGVTEATNFTAHTPNMQTSIHLIEGFNHGNLSVQPGGKRNSSKDVLPRQVVELRGQYNPNYKCTITVLGYNKRASAMNELGIMDTQLFNRTSNGQYLAVFGNCCCRYSSHSFGQRLALRFTLIDENGNSLCHIDSKFFQTITRRGREKRVKRQQNRSHQWSSDSLLHLMQGANRFGHHSLSCFEEILVNYHFESWVTPVLLQKKYAECVAADSNHQLQQQQHQQQHDSPQQMVPTVV